MVDHGRCREPSMCFTTHTQRMLPQVRLAEPLPLAAVTTLGGRRSVWVQGLMICTIQTVCQIGTAGVLAWLLTFPRHKVHLRIQRKPCGVPHGLSVSFLCYYYITPFCKSHPRFWTFTFQTATRSTWKPHGFCVCMQNSAQCENDC